VSHICAFLPALPADSPLRAAFTWAAREAYRRTRPPLVDVPSSKTLAILQFLDEVWARDASCKVVLFSQWTAYLDLFEHAFDVHFGTLRGLVGGGGGGPGVVTHRHADRVSCVRIDGDIQQVAERERVLRQFATDPDKRLLLMSLNAGGIGLNLTCASVAILADAWYNPFIEDQAMERVHRIGQTRPVTVVRFVTDMPIDSTVLAIQDAKRHQAACCLSGSLPGSRSTGKKGVGGVGEKEIHWMFHDIIATHRRHAAVAAGGATAWQSGGVPAGSG
jgi:hypothetical protein